MTETLAIYDLDGLSAWCGEPLLLDGEDPHTVLRDGTWRLRAVQEAHLQRGLGLERPTAAWRRTYGFALGLQRMAATDPIHLADETILGEHQAEVIEAALAALARQLEAELPSLNSFDPGMVWRLWFEHATGSGKTVSACALVDAARTQGVLILTHRTALVQQFVSELRQRGYGQRLVDPERATQESHYAPVSVATYQWFTRNHDQLDPSLYGLILCDEVHQSLGQQTSNAIQAADPAVVIGMTATGSLLAKDVSALFPTKVSTFDLQQAAALDVIAPLRVIRVPPGVSVSTLQNVTRRGGDLDPDELAALLDRDPLNYACAQFYKHTFGKLSGIVYAAGVRHAERVAVAFVRAGVPAASVSGQTPRSELQRILDDFEAGRLQVIVNAQLLVEGWNSPRVTVCLHLAPTASPRVYQQRIGRVTRRSPDKEAGLVVDFVPAAYRNDEGLVTLHSLLDLPAYQTAALVTRSPAEHEPAPINPPQPPVTVPVAAAAARRVSWLEEHLDDVSLSELPSDDRLAWGQLAGATAASPGQLAARLGELAKTDEAAFVAAARAALLDNPHPSMRTEAVELLVSRRSADALEALASVALSTDQPALAHNLVWRCLQLAHEGVPTHHERLLELARSERQMYERLARRDGVYRRLAATPIRDEDTFMRLLRAVNNLPSDLAASILVALPNHRTDWERHLNAAAQDRFPSTQGLARALLAHRHARAGDERQLVWSAG